MGFSTISRLQCFISMEVDVLDAILVASSILGLGRGSTGSIHCDIETLAPFGHPCDSVDEQDLHKEKYSPVTGHEHSVATLGVHLLSGEA